MAQQNTDRRRTLKEASRNPIAVFVYVVAAIEAINLGSFAIVISDLYRTLLLASTVFIITLVICLIAAIAYFRPEALWGKRHSALEENLASKLGNKIFQAMDGYLKEQKEERRDEIYNFLGEQITKCASKTDEFQQEFCVSVANSIKEEAKTSDKWEEMSGAMPS